MIISFKLDIFWSIRSKISQNFLMKIFATTYITHKFWGKMQRENWLDLYIHIYVNIRICNTGIFDKIRINSTPNYSELLVFTNNPEATITLNYPLLNPNPYGCLKSPNPYGGGPIWPPLLFSVYNRVECSFIAQMKALDE